MSSSNRWAFRPLAAILCAFQVLVVATGAWADPSVADKAEARELYVAGMELRDAGDKAGALAKFEKAYALVPSPITALAVGVAHEGLGHLIEARDMYVAAANLPIKATESPEAKTARTSAKERARDLRERIPTVKIKIVQHDGPAPNVLVDGEQVASEELTSPRAVNPGPHVFVVTADGRERIEKRVVVHERERAVIDLDIGEAPVAAAEESSATNPLVYWGFGGAAGAFAISGGSYLYAKSQDDDIADACGEGGCGSSVKERRDIFGALNKVFFGLGVVGVGVGIYGLVTPSKTTTAATATPSLSVGPGWLGFTGRF